MTVNFGNLLIYIMDYEQGNLEPEKLLDLFSYLIKTELAWTLQGSYGRSAELFIEQGWISPEGEILKEIGDA